MQGGDVLRRRRCLYADWHPSGRNAAGVLRIRHASDGFADKIALHDHENGADCEIVLAPAKLTTDAQISLTENDIECIKKLLHDCIEQPYYVSWLHDDLTAATKAGEMDLAVYVVGKTEQ